MTLTWCRGCWRARVATFELAGCRWTVEIENPRLRPVLEAVYALTGMGLEEAA